MLEDGDILLFPTNEEESQLEHESDQEVSEGDQSQPLIRQTRQSVPKEHVKITEVPSGVEGQSEEREPLCHQALILSQLALNLHLIDEPGGESDEHDSEVDDLELIHAVLVGVGQVSLEARGEAAGVRGDRQQNTCFQNRRVDDRVKVQSDLNRAALSWAERLEGPRPDF